MKFEDMDVWKASAACLSLSIENSQILKNSVSKTRSRGLVCRSPVISLKDLDDQLIVTEETSSFMPGVHAQNSGPKPISA